MHVGIYVCMYRLDLLRSTLYIHRSTKFDVCIFACMHVYIYIYVCVHMYDVGMYVYIYVLIYIYIYEGMYACMYIYIYVCTYMYV